MILLDKTRLQDVVDYVSKDTANCIYLYTDLTECGPDDPNVTIWFEENSSGMQMVVLKYYDCFQVYSHRDDCELNGLRNLIDEYGVSRIFARRGIIERLQGDYAEQYDTSYGKVLDLFKYKKLEYENLVEEATPADLDEIDALLMTDPGNARAYRPGELKREFEDRMLSGKGTNYIIRKDGRIVAHTCITAQTDLFKVSAKTIVRQEDRGMIYGAFIDSFLLNEIPGENMHLYTFMADEKRIRLFEIMGNKVVAQYGKLLKKK